MKFDQNTISSRKRGALDLARVGLTLRLPLSYGAVVYMYCLILLTIKGSHLLFAYCFFFKFIMLTQTDSDSELDGCDDVRDQQRSYLVRVFVFVRFDMQNKFALCMSSLWIFCNI